MEPVVPPQAVEVPNIEEQMQDVIPETVPQEDVTAPEVAEHALPEEEEAASLPTEIDILGEKVPVDEIMAWREAYENRQAWERAHKHKDMRYAAIRKELEQAFGVPFDKWSDAEIASLRVFSQIERQMRTDPTFRAAVQKAFAEIYRQGGATQKQAERQAAADVQQIERVAQATQALDPQLYMTLAKTAQEVEQVKAALVSQELSRLENSINSYLDSAIESHAKGFEPYLEEIEDRVLDRLHQAFDPEGSGEDKTALILQADYDGQLAPLIESLVRQEVRRIQMLGESVARSTQRPKPTVQPPLRGSAGVPVEPEEVTDIRDLHRRMKRMITGRG